MSIALAKTLDRGSRPTAWRQIFRRTIEIIEVLCRRWFRLIQIPTLFRVLRE
jgi:hypothetical protein